MLTFGIASKWAGGGGDPGIGFRWKGKEAVYHHSKFRSGQKLHLGKSAFLLKKRLRRTYYVGQDERCGHKRMGIALKDVETRI